jgi:hypothetical protein
LQPNSQPGGRFVAALVVTAAALAVAFPEIGLTNASGLIQADGRPTLDGARQPAASIGSWARIAPGDPPGIPILGPAALRTYLYDPASSATAASGTELIEVQVAPAGGAGMLSPSDIAARQSYRVVSASSVNLGFGLSGHLISLAGQSGQPAVVLLWWDWPVRSGATVTTQRVMVASSSLTGNLDHVIVNFGRGLIASMANLAGAGA